MANTVETVEALIAAATNASAVSYDLDDSIAAITTASDAVYDGATVVTLTDGDATVGQLSILVERGFDVADINVSGTAAQVTEALTDLAEMRGGAGNDDGVLTVTDNGTVEASVAVAEAMTADDGNFYTNYTLRDTAAALDAMLITTPLQDLRA